MELEPHSKQVAFEVESVDAVQREKDNNKEPRPRGACMSYKTFMWIVVILSNAIAVIDRFTINLWPLWVDSPGPTIPGNWSVSSFTLTAWISSRVLLVSSSWIFWLQCNVFWNWFVEKRQVAKDKNAKSRACSMDSWLEYGDVIQDNHSIHYWIGIFFIGIPLLLHVWTIIFCSWFGTKINVFSSWMRPSSGDIEVKFFNQEENLLNLGINDIYRIITSSLEFLLLMPISMIPFCKKRNWSTMMYIHLFAALIYTVDLLRMYSHPHCWFFNIPFILWWMLDRAAGIWYYRRFDDVEIRKKVVFADNKYMLLYLKLNAAADVVDVAKMRKWCGDVWYLNTRQGCKNWDRAHPFTVFSNHHRQRPCLQLAEQDATKSNADSGAAPDVSDQSSPKITARSLSPKALRGVVEDAGFMERRNKFSIDMTENLMRRRNTESFDGNFLKNEDHNDDGKEKEQDTQLDGDWDIGVLAAVFPVHDGCANDKRNPWTNQVRETPVAELNLVAFGPYRSEYRLLFVDDLSTLGPVILIGTGAGCSYMVDFYNHFTSLMVRNRETDVFSDPVQFYFSARSIDLFHWFTNITCHGEIAQFSVNAHLTSHDEISYDPNNSERAKARASPSRDARIGRLSFVQMLEAAPVGCRVFFCGSPFIQEQALKLCKKRNLQFIAGHSFY